ncbi:MAG: DUF3791 domain-containing protein [Treponema sp.]|jgi:hypothetical protein|nr:DUF3791 domain-containing protein [Treponema sp.]
MCKKEVDFLIYCIEFYKAAKGLTGAQTIHSFDSYGVTGFILECYEALHIEGESAIIQQIDDFIAHHPLEGKTA